MATKRFIIEIEDGYTTCNKECPFNFHGNCYTPGFIEKLMDCDSLNMSSIKIEAI